MQKPLSRRPAWAAIVIATWAFLLLHVSPVRAENDINLDEEPASPATEAAAKPVERRPMEVAREHMDRGQALFGAGRYIESAEEFLRAYSAQPFAAFLFNAGVSYEKNDDPGRAADFFDRFLQADPQVGGAAKLRARVERLRGLARARDQEKVLAAAANSSNSQDAAAAQAELDQAKARLAELEAQLAALGGRDAFKSLLSVQTTPEDATVSLKTSAGVVVANGPGASFSSSLDEGDYIVEVAHPKYKTISTPLHVVPGKVYVIIVEMSQGQFLGFLRVTSSVPGASVYVDKRDEGALGKTPFENAMRTGKHHMWIEKPGYKPVERDIDVRIGEELVIPVPIERVDFGRLQVVASRPDAKVHVDGKALGTVPLEVDLPHGKHAVRVSAEGMKDWKTEVTLERGQATPVRVKLRPAVSRAGGWVTAGAAAAVLGGSIAVGLIGKGLHDELDRDLRAGLLVSDDDRAQRGKYMYWGADAGFVVTLGLAGLATWYFVRDPLPDSEGRTLVPRDWAFSPTLHLHGGGANVGARF
jgi:hypothetical protein